MKLTVRSLRSLLREALVSASADYMRKEAVRQRLQDMLVSMVKSGEIQSDEDLADFWKTVDMSARALQMVPLKALKK